MNSQALLRFPLLLLLLLMIGQQMLAQAPLKPVAAKVLQQTAKYQSAKPWQLLSRSSLQDLRAEGLQGEVAVATLLDVQTGQVRQLLDQREEHIRLQLPVGPGNAMLELWLYRADILTPEFQVRTSAGNGAVFPYQEGLYYWGIVKGDENSLAAIAVSEDEIMGFVSIGADKFVLGKLKERNTRTHVLYKEADLKIEPDFTCGTDDVLHYMGKEPGGTPEKNADNCVRMYIEIDNDLVVAMGGVTQATNHVTGAFSQVAVLYANEAVNLTVNAIFAWNTADPYTGPSTLDFLNQFRTNLNGNFNGDLAHLVGTQGGGGIAYVDVLCNQAFGVGYSAVELSYSNVPTYSWTVEVLTHEIGHNLGSRHTHACVWNGNNTPIDCCGYNAGYPESSCGSSYSCTIPNPVGGGTIMSYCHLLGGVGINFNNGFGPQPGNLIRNEVYNAPCLVNCNAAPCDIFTSTNVPVSIPNNQTATVTSSLSIPASGSVTDVNVKNLNITHTWINDLIIKIISPAGTEVTLINQICGDQDNMLTNLDDETAPYSSLPCPPVNNGNYQPLQALSAFDGQNVNGTWTLTVQDMFNEDGGSLNAWGLQVCYDNPTATLSAPTVTQPTCAVTTGTIVVNASGSALEYSINGGSSFQSSATFSGLAPGSYNIVARLVSNPAYLIFYSGNPVVLSAAQAPALTAPTVTQPTCAAPTGTIVVNATGTGPLEFSINGGSSYQSSATFSNLAPGTYNLRARLQSNPSCVGVHPSGVAIIPATGCCAQTLAIGGSPIASGTYQAAEVITSTGVVANGFDVIFKAGNMVELAADFEVIIGGGLEVIMVGCTP
jgi:subtilisin-like proprotein convertase family protein